MASTEGGMNIEEVAEEHPEKIIKEWIDPVVGLQPFQARKIAFALGWEGNAFKEGVKFINSLYTAYLGLDASMFEINPVWLYGPYEPFQVFAPSQPDWANRDRSAPMRWGSTSIGS